MTDKFLIATMLLSPLIGFLINGLLVNYNNKSYLRSGIVATVAAAISFLAAATLFLKLLGVSAPEVVKAHFFEWINVGQFKANAAFVVDHISGIMILIITGVGTLIHLYSIGYMSHDEKPAKYFSYLNLFLFNMLILVLGDNLLLLFVGWEGVGLCSYLLIGFWFTDSEKAKAGMKAFVVNRIGDAGFILGLFLIFILFKTVEFEELAKLTYAPELGWGLLTFATMFLFIGATGKSAQIPLYVWLPDAMAGPTPVSALIHAATMVTAGVYMIVRLNFMFMATPNTMMLIATIGALTAVFAASIGLFQNDIKKILAYSTVSQLGYMFLGVGVGAFKAGMFHLMTHAFFKALMFLGAGSVIHGMHEEQDVRKMGGLSKKMPITYLTFLFGWLAIIGTPLFSGFFSKDEILWKTFASPMGSKFLWFLGVLGAALTAFYMTRLMALTFWGKSRVDKSVHVHESPIVMTLPLVILAVLSLIGGWVGIPEVIGHIFSIPNGWEHWLSKQVVDAAAHGSHLEEWLTMATSVILAGCSAYCAYFIYTKKADALEKLKNQYGKIYNIISNKYYIDELYQKTIVVPLVLLSKWFWSFVDVKIVDRTTYLLADIVRGAGSSLRLMVNGNVQQYALYIVAGMVAVLVVILTR
ncbi:MAG: NADH-quinone oxidoreductase subunit L [Oligoflexia bacterium]|nr:NADH-quinone oxidoreductase subunit L [Oligoflexia bacterium]